VSYDQALAERLRTVLQDEPAVAEQRMFGGLAFLINGRLAVAASHSGGLLLRCDPTQTDALVHPPLVDRFEMRGRRMDGWLRVDAAAVADDAELHRWVGYGLAYAADQPAQERRRSG
jgi:hypothetical protein